IAGVFVFNFVSHLNDFPGSATARKLLGIAASTRPLMLDPVNAEAGTLSDLFFMKHGLEHYDVPAEFADFDTIGCRVFEDDESRRGCAACFSKSAWRRGPGLFPRTTRQTRQKTWSPPRTAAMKQTPLCSVTAPVQPSW